MSSSIQIVTLDHFYDQSSDPEAQHFFAELIVIRKEGYGPDYPSHFLPMDTVDFIATHHLFCVEENGQLEPVGAFRNLSLKRAEYYGLTLPILRLVHESGSKPHIQWVESLLESHRRTKKDLMYSSSLVIKKEFRKNRQECQNILDLTSCMTHFDLNRFNIGITIGGSALRFKTKPLFEKWGYRASKNPDGSELGPLQKKSAGHELVQLMQLETMSEHTLQCLKTYAKTFETWKIFTAKTQIAEAA